LPQKPGLYIAEKKRSSRAPVKRNGKRWTPAYSQPYKDNTL